jgi:hypothetical protein
MTSQNIDSEGNKLIESVFSWITFLKIWMNFDFHAKKNEIKFEEFAFIVIWYSFEAEW